MRQTVDSYHSRLPQLAHIYANVRGTLRQLGDLWRVQWRWHSTRVGVQCQGQACYSQPAAARDPYPAHLARNSDYPVKQTYLHIRTKAL